MSKRIYLIVMLLVGVFIFIFLTSCSPTETKKGEMMKEEMNTDWKKYLEANIGLLGHRNWIVVTDMAYPLQSKPGIVTIDTAEDYNTVLSFVDKLIKVQPHVRSVVYQDLELKSLTDKEVPGIEKLREEAVELFEGEISYVEHETLIARLDEVSQVFNVIILKSNLTIPYTTTFFELDCKYWQ